MKPRLRHVAELAGVSQATVSRVLNGKAGVSETTRREVLRALNQLGYEPVGVARARRRGLVGLIVPELDNPVFPRFAQAIESRLANEGLTTVLCTSTPAGMVESDYLEVLLDHAVTGVILVSGLGADTTAVDDHARYLDLLARGVAAVLVNGAPTGLPVPSVTVDHATAARQAVGHLAALGHRRIGLAIGPRRYLPSIELTEGYRQGLAEARHDDELVSETLYGIEGGHAAAVQLLARGATGIVCGSDLMAMGAIRAIREQGLSVPGDVSVIGFDDAGPNPYVHPPLTSVQQPFEAMAQAVVQLLGEQPLGDRDVPHLRFRPELVVRATTGPARVPAVDATG
ncbi:LacI family DNA-binding transcriptional regulator [Egicoccus halophilus]|uniref:HTH-type transcriptional regulator MalR n=1 Tax=Egicoccus halophilus TaxID=1670830 RepID=A0A8J3ABZ7_9ACTN|nr:LacI family DNA-binding transcriptional regulator [Egicoccus halophilus]GGI03783.1 HTH-type transcriptional regulator MalR [Egicoccus halophilus]